MEKRREKEVDIPISIDERLEQLNKAAKIRGKMIKHASQVKIGRESEKYSLQPKVAIMQS